MKKIYYFLRNIIYKDSSDINRGHFRIRRIVYAGVSTLGAKVINLLVTLISIPLTYNYLDTASFGLLMTILSFVGMLSFADLGLGFGLLNRIAEYDVNNDKIGLRKSISSAFSVLFCFTILGFLFLWISKGNINWNSFLNFTKSIENNDVSKSVEIFFIIFLTTLPFSIITKIQIGFQETHINQFWEAIGNFVSIFSIFIVIKLKLSVPYIILALYGTPSIFIIFNFLYQFLFIRRHLFPSIKFIDIQYFLGIFKEGMVFFILQLLAIGANSSDNFFIAKYIGVEEVAIFAIAYKVISMLIIPIQAFVGPLLPAINDAIASMDFSWLKRAVKFTFVILIIFSLIFSLIFILFANPIIHIWINKDINLNLLYRLSFIILFIYMALNILVTSIFLSKKYINKTFKYYPIAAIIVILLKIFYAKQQNVEAMLIVPLIIFSIFYFYPLYKNLQKSF